MSVFSMRGIQQTTVAACRRLLQGAAFASAVLLAGQATAATALFEDFTGGLNGWVSEGGLFGIRTDGGPGGVGDAYMFTSDNENSAMAARFGPEWTGDLSPFDGATLSFDFLHEAPVKPALLGSFGRIMIDSPNGYLEGDAYAGLPATSWTSAAIAFEASTFNTTQASWLSILGDVSSIELRLESWSGNTEVVGLDNVSLAPVPLPASLLFLLGGLGMMVAFRRLGAVA